MDVCLKQQWDKVLRDVSGEEPQSSSPRKDEVAVCAPWDR
jgi:hypothetical protein